MGKRWMVFGLLVSLVFGLATVSYGMGKAPEAKAQAPTVSTYVRTEEVRVDFRFYVDDSASNKPVEGALVKANLLEINERASAYTDSQGVAKLFLLGGKTYSYNITKSGYQSLADRVYIPLPIKKVKIKPVPITQSVPRKMY